MAIEKSSKITPWEVKQKEKFLEEYGDKTDKELQQEILYQLIRIRKISSKTRANTSSLVTWIIVIPIVVGILLGLLQLL